MLDEVWLRVRRGLVHRLEKSGQWMEHDAYAAFMRERKTVGQALSQGVLREALGEEDFCLIQSESAYARACHRLSTRIPLILSFGSELGCSFYGLMDRTGQHARRAGEICAVFNLGISIFDLVQDCYPELVEEFAQCFHEQVLAELATDVSETRRLELRLTENSQPELRILLRIIVWFHQRIREAAKEEGAADAQRCLAALLREAYRSETESRVAPAMENALEVSRAKSSLPFLIICQTARLLAKSADGDVEPLARHIGDVFWLVDDLVDIPADFRDGALNAVVIDTSASSAWKRASREEYEALAGLLRGASIERAIDRLDENFRQAARILADQRLDGEAARRLRRVMAAYVRDWLG